MGVYSQNQHLLDLHKEFPGGLSDPFVDLNLAELSIPVANVAEAACQHPL